MSNSPYTLVSEHLYGTIKGIEREFPVLVGPWGSFTDIPILFLAPGRYRLLLSAIHTDEKPDVSDLTFIIRADAMSPDHTPCPPLESLPEGVQPEASPGSQPAYGGVQGTGITTSMSYFREKTMLSPDASRYLDEITYMDGLGRPVQEVRIGAAPSGADLVDYTDYNSNGMPWRHWTSVAVSGKDGAFVRNQPRESRTVTGDSRPYTETLYEPLTEGRPTRIIPMGEAWADHSQTYFYRTNLPADSCRCYTVGADGVLRHTDFYATGELSVVKTTDEDGNQRTSFTDRLGRVLLERHADGDTYYVYLPSGDLGYVLPPGLEGRTDSASLALYAYAYSYDGLHRMVKKTLPGCAPVTYAYDKADRPLFVRDGNQSETSDCLFMLYDSQGRLAVKGLCHYGPELSSVGILSLATYSPAGGSHGSGYVFPPLDGVTDIRLLEVTYYDTYDFLSLPVMRSRKDSLSYIPLDGYGIRYINEDAPASSSSGRMTGRRVFIASGTDSGESEQAVSFYYDERGRVIQTRKENFLGGYDSECSDYSFSGQVRKRLHVHSAAGALSLSEEFSYTYDHGDRLTRVTHRLDSSAAVTLTENGYDEFCRLQSHRFHGGGDALEYSYDIHNWLIALRHPLFEQKLHYADGPGIPCYHGTISSMEYKTGNESVSRGYKYVYDPSSRLTDAVYGEGPALSSNANRFTERVTAYDKQGNILGLERYGQISATGYGLIDDLSLSYAGNRLERVTDHATAPSFNHALEFKDGVDADIEYAYDKNGNLTEDLNKNITAIRYNYLNLPILICFANGNSISYVYDAEGTKLRTTHLIGGVTTTTDYCGNVIYENGVASRLLTGEGYVTLDDDAYHYYLRDHQGNNRVVMSQDGTLEEVNHYYPFGGTFASTGNVQPYKYNGKELDRKGGLDWYDYGARMYDPVLGRWHAMDRLAEKYYWISPYAYCLNDPILLVDPNGMRPIWGGIGRELNHAFNAGMSFANGAVRAVADNIFLGQTSLRETGIYSSASAYNAGQDVGDILSIFLGGAEAIRGAGEVTAGVLGAPETVGASLSVSAKGVVDVTHGTLMATSAAVKLFSKKGRIQEVGNNESQASGRTPEYKQPKSGSGKERANNPPSWAKEERPYKGENGKDFAKRIMEKKYGKGSKYRTGPDSEYNKIKKYGDRSFE